MLPIYFPLSSRFLCVLAEHSFRTSCPVSFRVRARVQPAFPTEFPAESRLIALEALTTLLASKVYKPKRAIDPEIRVEYRDKRTFLNIGNTSDNGK